MHNIHYNFKRLTQTLSLNLNTLSQSLKHSLKVQTLSLKHRNQSSSTPSSLCLNTLSQYLKHSLKVQTLSLKHRNQSSSTPRRATKITLTLKRSPFSSKSASNNPLTHTLKSLLSLPTKVQIFSSLKVCFSYKNLSFLNNYSIWV